MNLTDALLPESWKWASALIFAAILAKAVWRAPWHRLADARQHNVWLGACAVIFAFWSVRTGIRPGLDFHLLGATALTLLVGPWLAILGLTLVLLGTTVLGAGGWTSLPMNAIVMIAVPVAISYFIYRMADARLPNHFFVYTFVNGFVAAAISIGTVGLAANAVLAASGAYTWDYLSTHYLPYYMLIAWSEAVATGMAITILVVYRPKWVTTFDDARYIRNK